jgi:Flp pilus assembly protein TadG
MSAAGPGGPETNKERSPTTRKEPSQTGPGGGHQMKPDKDPSREGERGAIAILMALALVGLIGAASLAVDIGSALVTKTELQNVADASSLAATREVALIYKGLSANTDYKTYTMTSANIAAIKSKAATFAAANKAAGLSIGLASADTITATYDVKTGNITPSTTGVRAVRVVSRRDETQNGRVQTALAGVLGINEIGITAQSTAAISALGSLKAGKGEFPIALDEDWWKSHSCGTNETLQFYPTSPNSCLGWHTFDSKPASAAKLKNIVKGIGDGSFQSPETIAGETYYEFTGGTISSALQDLEDLFKLKRSGGSWTVNAPVYESNNCVNPNQQRKIVGFTRVRLTEVKAPPNAKIEGDVECGIYNDDELGDGGGPGDYGVLVGTPGMIE